jgi:acetyl esterase/lipase
VTVFRDLDLAETGNRELTGEWVVGTDVWRRLKSSKARRGRSTNKSPLGKESPIIPKRDSPAAVLDKYAEESDKGKVNERVIYYIHGGAYYVGTAATHRLITIGVSKACNARVFGELGFSKF